MITTPALAMRDAIEEVRVMSIREAERRGKVATGRTISTLSTNVTTSDAAVTGRLEGESQWQYVGNGRKPGGVPPIDNIRRWVIAKGLDLDPVRIAWKIAKDGSKDWRNRAPNVFLSAYDDYVAGGGLDRLEEQAGKAYEQQAVDAAIKYFK